MKLSQIVKEIKVKPLIIKPPDGWKASKISNDNYYDGGKIYNGKIIHGWSTPGEGWDDQHKDWITIIKSETNIYTVIKSFSFSNDEFFSASSYQDARQKAFNFMIELNKSWGKNINEENFNPSKDLLSLRKILKEVMINEYAQPVIDKMMVIFRPQTRLDDPSILSYINRFKDLKSVLRQKFDKLETKATVEPLIPKELQDKNKYLDITLWNDFEVFKKMIDAISKRPEDIYKKAIEYYKKKNPQVDERAIKIYVAKFKLHLKDIKQQVEDKDETIINLIPQELLDSEKYLVITNWTDLHQLETLIDTIFPDEQKHSTKVELNSAETDGDLIYNKNQVEIYKGDSEHKCIRYGKNKYYSWCISNPHGSMYTGYRLGTSRGNKLMFYFVFDKNKTDEKEGRFKDPYHAVVIHALDNGKYRRTNANNDGDEPSGGANWEELGNYFIGNQGQELWQKIKNLKNLFVYLPPSKDELKIAEFRNKHFSLKQVSSLSSEDKRYWLISNASIQDSNGRNDIITPDIVKTLNADDKNLLINNGKMFSFDELKSNLPLLKRYPDYRFTRNPDEPLPYKFIPYLKQNYPIKNANGETTGTVDLQRKYYEKFEADYLTFDEIEKYFDKTILQEYIDRQIKTLDFLPEETKSYLNEKQKKLFEVYSIAFLDKNYIETSHKEDTDIKAPRRSVTIPNISYDTYKDLEPQKRTGFLEFLKKIGSKKGTDYPTFFMGCPITFYLQGKLFFFLPSHKDSEESYLINEEGKILSRDNVLDIEIYNKNNRIEPNSEVGGCFPPNSFYFLEKDFDSIIFNKKDGGVEKMKINDFFKLNEQSNWFGSSLLYRAGLIK